MAAKNYKLRTTVYLLHLWSLCQVVFFAARPFDPPYRISFNLYTVGYTELLGKNPVSGRIDCVCLPVCSCEGVYQQDTFLIVPSIYFSTA